MCSTLTAINNKIYRGQCVAKYMWRNTKILCNKWTLNELWSTRLGLVIVIGF